MISRTSFTICTGFPRAFQRILSFGHLLHSSCWLAAAHQARVPSSAPVTSPLDCPFTYELYRILLLAPTAQKSFLRLFNDFDIDIIRLQAELLQADLCSFIRRSARLLPRIFLSYRASLTAGPQGSGPFISSLTLLLCRVIFEMIS